MNNNDNITCFLTGKVVSDIAKNAKAAQFFCDVVVPGGMLKVLVRVDVTPDFHLVIPKGSYVDIFSGEVYISSNETAKLAVRVKNSKQINVCAPYRGEEDAEDLLRKEDTC